MFEITMLPARQGDAIWVRWGSEGDRHQMLIDMGTEETGTQIHGRIAALPKEQRKFDLLVVTHVDSDHIGGVLTCLAEAEPIPGLKITDVWFNGYQHLSGGAVAQPGDDTSKGLEPMGPAQGERLSTWLRKQKWNKKLKGAPVERVSGKPMEPFELPGDLKITVLGPTRTRLEALIGTWEEEVREALKKGTLTEVSPGLERMGAKVPPQLHAKGDLKALADTKDTPENKAANGSSIALLLQYKEHKVVLAGDAFADDLAKVLGELGEGGRLKLDAFKLPHHCSKNNVLRPLIEAVDCERWLISTDGSGNQAHPDAIGVARVITYSRLRKPVLWFNVPSKINGWWNNPDWKERYDYKTEYGTKEDGLSVPLE